MIVFKLISVVLSFHFGLSLTSIEDQFLNEQMIEHFGVIVEEISDETFGGNFQKREAVEVSNEDKKYSSLFTPFNFTKSHHYWTRKRGREKTSQLPTENYYTLYPTRSYGLNTINNNNSRKKREAMERFFKLHKVSARIKREIELEVNSTEINSDLIAKNDVPPEVPKAEVPPENTIQKHVHDHLKNGSRDSNFDQTVERRAKKCCAEDLEFHGFNESMLAIRTQCLAETWKNRQNVSEEVFEGDGGIFTMFSCGRMKRWKTLTMCTIDCFAQNLGMFDSNGVLSSNVAKRVVRENFIVQEWEQDASDDLVEKCSKEVKESTSKPVNAFGFQCNSKPAEFVYCMWRELFLICPSEKQVRTMQCEKLRKVLKKFSDNKFSN